MVVISAHRLTASLPVYPAAERLSTSGGSIELERKTNVQHHSQADDLRARF